MSFATPSGSTSLLLPVASVRTSDIVAGTVPAGTRYLILDEGTDGAASSVLVGSYGNQIKINNSRYQMNVSGTLDTVQALNYT